MMAYRMPHIKKYLHGIAVKGRLAYAMRAGSVGMLCDSARLLEASGRQAARERGASLGHLPG